MRKNKSLARIILSDIFRRSKMTFLLFIGLIVTTMLTIHKTNATRQLRYELEQNIVEKRALDIEWRSLILEENTLGEQQRIDKIASYALKMKHITPENEGMLIIPKGQ